jgi:AraC family transcriptional regulator, regulatory protein of adaptative response / methylated-DNA-[protein]-cysteine methyltransferase
MMQQNIDYQRVAQAITFLSDNFKQQPTLEAVAQHVHVSPQHFQRLFTDWSGVSPKKFLQFLSINHLRSRIYDTKNLHEAADLVGFSAQSRVYDLFMNIENVTPHAYKTAGKGLAIDYGFHQTPFGECLVAQTGRGVCWLSFVDENTRQMEFNRFLNRWQSADLRQNPKNTEGVVGQIFSDKKTEKINLLAQGTPFQLKVWEALLTIPEGAVTTYQKIAEAIGSPKAVRAVGTAVGQNPIGYLIPCHRVIRKEGQVGEYHWGSVRKKVILGYEMARTGS